MVMAWTHVSCSSSTFLAESSSFNIDNGNSSGRRGRKLSSLPIACVTSKTPSTQNLPKPPSPPALFLANNNARSPRPLTAQRQMGRAARLETVIPDPDYRIPIVLLGLAGISLYGDNLLAAAPIGLLGLLLLFQTTRVRFVFDEEALEVKVGEQLQESSENVFVGGKNRWKYSTFVNWELWWPNFPILVYFKETQTRPEGQVHFFPVIFNGRQLYDVMVERAGTSQTSGPKGS